MFGSGSAGFRAGEVSGNVVCHRLGRRVGDGTTLAVGLLSVNTRPGSRRSYRVRGLMSRRVPSDPIAFDNRCGRSIDQDGAFRNGILVGCCGIGFGLRSTL